MVSKNYHAAKKKAARAGKRRDEMWANSGQSSKPNCPLMLVVLGATGWAAWDLVSSGIQMVA